MYYEQLETQKAKQKARRKEWADERKRLLRCLETQTRHNSIHLQARHTAEFRVIICVGVRWLQVDALCTSCSSADTAAQHVQELSQALGPEGSLRQSLDLSAASAPLGSRRHSLAFPPTHGGSTLAGGSSICSSPCETVRSLHTGSGLLEVRSCCARRHRAFEVRMVCMQCDVHYTRRAVLCGVQCSFMCRAMQPMASESPFVAKRGRRVTIGAGIASPAALQASQATRCYSTFNTPLATAFEEKEEAAGTPPPREGGSLALDKENHRVRTRVACR